MDCSIYKSPKKQDLYLYVARQDDLSRVPEALLSYFGTPEHVLDLDLTADRKLAREDPIEVLKNLREKGFHLQMPESKEPGAVRS
jgi:uncharacterized protein YcgL (UPF0745 family)